MSFYRARLEVLVGNRRMNRFIVNADLGLTGLGLRDVWIIDYKPGEVVDAARVTETMEKTKALMEKETTEHEIMSYKILDIVQVEYEQPNAKSNQTTKSELG